MGADEAGAAGDQDGHGATIVMVNAFTRKRAPVLARTAPALSPSGQPLAHRFSRHGFAEIDAGVAILEASCDLVIAERRIEGERFRS